MSDIAINTSPTAELMTALLENVEPESIPGLLLVVLVNLGNLVLLVVHVLLVNLVLLLVKGGLVVVAPADPSGITGQVRPAKNPAVKQDYQSIIANLPFSETDGKVVQPKIKKNNACGMIACKYFCSL